MKSTVAVVVTAAAIGDIKDIVCGFIIDDSTKIVDEPWKLKP